MSLSVHYFSFNQKRADKLWKNFADDLAKAKAGVIFDMYMNPFGGLTHPDDLRNEDTVLTNLKLLDLNYGSQHCEPTESGKIEFLIVETLAKAADMRLANGLLSKEDWIRLYSNIDNDFVARSVGLLTKEIGWTDEESREILLEFLHNVRPVVKNLKENQDSIFIYYADTSDEVAPDSAEEVLVQRARDHLRNFRNIILPNY